MGRHFVGAIIFYHLLSRCFREDVCTGKMVEVCDVRFEEACILYNIAALHSFLGCMDTRSNAEVIAVLFLSLVV